MTADNNPYFLQAASQLATALHIEQNAAVRESIVEALGNMATWDKLPDDNILRTKLIDRIAHANRMAKANFITAFAAWSVVSAQWEAWGEYSPAEGASKEATAKAEAEAKSKAFTLLVGLTRFCNTPEKTTSALETLMTERAEGSDRAKFTVAQEVHRAKREAMKDPENRDVELKKDTAQRLPSLETAALTLIDTRDALANALRTLTPQCDFPVAEISLYLEEIEKAQNLMASLVTEQERKEVLKQINARVDRISKTIRLWRDDVRKGQARIEISSCFLAGANLSSAMLAGASLGQTILTGAYLTSANLTGADLRHANLNRAHINAAILNGADVTSATLIETKLDGSALIGTIFDAAILTRATFLFATLIETRFQEATLTEAYLGGTSLIGVNFSNATLKKALIGVGEMIGTYFRGVNLAEADLSDCAVAGSCLDRASVIPPTWNRADYRKPNGEEDAELKARVENAYQKQREVFRKNESL